MAKKALMTFLITLMSVCITSCSSQDNKEPSRQLSVDNVQHKEDVWDTLSKESLTAETDKSSGEQEENKLFGGGIGQLVIENPISEERFSIKNGTDIWYNNILYKGLYSNVEQIETPYSKNEFINAVIRLYVTNESPVYTESVVDPVASVSDNSIEADASELASVVTIDEQLQGNRQYLAIKEKYDKPAVWRLNLFNEDRKNLGSIVGCSSYVVLLGVEDTVHFDMNKAITKDIKEHEQQKESSLNSVVINQVSENSVDRGWEFNFYDVDTPKTKFRNLATVASNLESPYTNEELITYIVNSYKTDVSTVYCEQTIQDNEDDTLSFGEELLENFEEQYRVYRETYGKDVNWKISIFEYGGTNEMVLYGCDSYVIVTVDNSLDTIEEQETYDQTTETSETLEQPTEQVETTSVEMESEQ